MKANIFCLFLLLCIVGCSTSRNTFVNRKYHDLNAHYNVLFNGRDVFKQAAKKVEAIEPQSFDEILPVFAFEYQQTPGLIAGDMQRVIDKGNKTIAKHSITAKPKKKRNMTREQQEFYNKKEYNIYVDDAQLVIGKAYTYMNELGTAGDKFAFIGTEYPKENAAYDAQLWQAIVFTQEKEYTKAEDLLVSLTRKKDVPEKIKPAIETAFANLKIKQNNYSEAIPHLEKALKRAGGKSTKIRYNYILGQLHQKTGNNFRATEYFSKVLKKNPPYFTAFNAEMAMAYAYDPATQKGNIRKILEKALRNEQNIEYHDQIYYAFAKLEESEENIPTALNYYHKSVSATGVNTRQKGLSYLALAEYYENQAVDDYTKTHIYYDSAAIMLGTNHSLYPNAHAKALKYRKIAVNMQVIVLEDSLLSLSKLSDSELRNLAEKKSRQKEEEKLKAEEAKLRLEGLKSDMDAVSTQGQWYFYNPTSVSLGRTDFDLRWGKRKLEDNWRRKNKGLQQTQVEYDDWGETLTQIADQNNTADVETFIAGIPKTEEAKKASNDKIITAMFNVAEAYRDDLNNINKSIETFEKLNQRYPTNNMQAESYVALYKLYLDVGNQDKANYYKNLMLLNFPTNPQVQAATDQGYVNRMKLMESSEESDYNAALNLYTSNRMQEANRAATEGLNKNPQGKLAPQFTLLKVLTDNYNGDIVKYSGALKNIIEKFPENSAAIHAQTLLAEIQKHELEWASETKQDTPNTPATQSFVTINYSREDGPHMFAVIVDSKIDVNRLQFNILQFNLNNYLESGYKVQVVDFADKKMILVGDIKNKSVATEYYKKIIADAAAFKDIPASSYNAFVILDINLSLMFMGTTFIEYVDFFKRTY